MNFKKRVISDDSRIIGQLLCFAVKRIPESRVFEETDGADALRKLSDDRNTLKRKFQKSC
jgi:hypothetical protein